ncbi:MAG: ribosome small subunit-dependent GTPase A [Planctomycetes bacterium]|nr:ribosome small subunit-dependent GTPase A [Planctomycetota bacterium]
MKDNEFRKGRIVRIHGLDSVVRSDGEDIVCSFRGVMKKEKRKLTNLGAVGDYVTFSMTEGEKGVIEDIEERRNALERRRVDKGTKRFTPHKQVIAANVDQLVIVASLREPPLKLYQVDRLLVAASMSKLHPVIFLNKVDLAESQEEIDWVFEVYANANCTITSGSAQNGDTAGLLELMRDKTSVISGPSGAGKSTLINNLGVLSQRTGDVNTKTRYGSHTTTNVSLLELPSGGCVIDTPGIREFDAWHATPKNIGSHYPEFAEIAQGCRFRDCLHIEEPDCRVKDALEAGEIHPNRYRTYQILVTDLGGISKEF